MQTFPSPSVSVLLLPFLLSISYPSFLVSSSFIPPVPYSSSIPSFPLHLNDEDPLAVGKAYDGIGAITSNGETRYIYDYAEPYRTQLLDFLFLPSYGLSLQILKVEIGSDAQSTLGTEAAHIHNRNESPACNRGIQFWYAYEARQRNPSIKIAALEWSGPGWFTNSSFFSGDNINFLLSWLDCMEHTWNVTVDYLGIWNEPPITSVPIDYLFSLRQALDDHNYSHILIDATDTGVGASATVNLVDDLVRNSSLQEAVNIVSMHHPCGTLPPNYNTLMESNPVMRAWASEDYSLIGDANGQACWGVTPARNWVVGNVTATIAWGVAFSALPNVLCQGKGYLWAMQPWSNAYTIGPAAWAMSMWTWFTKVGYLFLNVGYGSGFLPPTANSTDIVTTLIAPTVDQATGNRDFTIMVSSQNCSVSCFLSTPNPSGGVLNISINGNLAVTVAKLGYLYVWVTNTTNAMVQLPNLPVQCQSSTVDAVICTVTFTYRPNSLYALTTLDVLPTNTSSTILSPPFTPYINIGTPDSFPLTYSDDFESTPVESYGKYWADWDGSFQVVPDPVSPSTNQVLRAMTLQRPIPWHCTDVDPITMIAPGYQNYDVMVAARIDANATLIARKKMMKTTMDPSGSNDRTVPPTNKLWSVNRTDNLQYFSSSAASASSSSDASSCTTVACANDNVTPIEPFVGLIVRINKPFNDWCPQQTGYFFGYYGNGTWALTIWPGNAAGLPSHPNLLLATGFLPNNPNGMDTWHTLHLVVYQSNLLGYIDGTQVLNVYDTTFDHGTIGVGSGWHFASFDNFAMNQVGPGTPPGLVLYSEYLDAGMTQDIDALVGMIVIPQVSVTITGLCRFAAKNSSLPHDMYLIRSHDNQTLGTVQVVMNGSTAGGVEPYGFICSTFRNNQWVTMDPNEKYYIVSSETKNNDWHYNYGPATACAGDQSVRSPVMGVRSAFNNMFTFPGSVYLSRGSASPSWEWVEGGENEPRSLGPVNFMVQV